MARIVAVANQKGGVAKTTTVHALGFALAQMGRRVLLVDLDPQACLTYSVGIDPENLHQSLHDVFVRKMKAADARRIVTSVEGLDILPATIDLAGSEVHLLTRTGREHVLALALGTVADEYDMILIDCPPSLGVLTINGLTAAHEVLIPLQCEALSHRGVGQLLETIDDVRMFANADLEVRGVIATMYDERDPPRQGRARRRQGPLRAERAGAARAQVDQVRRSPRPGALHLAARPLVAGRRGIPRHRSRARRRPASGALSVPAGRHARPVTDAPDPLGKRALFWAPAQRDEGGPRRPAERDVPGKHALFSDEARAVGHQAAPRRLHGACAAPRPAVPPPGPIGGILSSITVDCATCGARSEIHVTEFLMLHLPIWLWRPGRGYTRFMTCPACRRRTWVSASWAPWAR